MTATNAVVCMLRPKVLQFLFKSLDLLSKFLQFSHSPPFIASSIANRRQSAIHERSDGLVIAVEHRKPNDRFP